MSKACFLQIKKSIQQCKKKKSDIKSIDLTGIKIIQFANEPKRLVQQLLNLQILYLPNCSLSRIDNLPNLMKLTQIDLTQNNLGDDEVKYLKRYKNLRVVNLGSNHIQRLDTFNQLKNLKDLQQLELYENPIAENQQYRPQAFGTITSLNMLDGCDINGVLIEEEEDYGQDIIIEEEDKDESQQNWQREKYSEDYENQGEMSSASEQEQLMTKKRKLI